MRLDTRLFRGTLAVLALALVAAILASPAAADHGRRYKARAGQGGWEDARSIVVAPGPRPVYYVSHGSSVGPAFAGFIGGLVLGNMLAHAAPPPPAVCAPAPVYGYYDPYCHERFVSLESFGGHLGHMHHPAFVRVIEVGSGRCVGERAWRNGRWCDPYDSCGRYRDDGDGDWDD